MNNIFLGANGGDPLLGANPYIAPSSVDLESQIERLKQAQQQMEAYKNAAQNATQNPQAKQTKTPIWDEIDTLVNGMTDTEVETLNSNEEYQNSQQRIMMILQREYMNVMRPIVESTKDGKEALENHLDLTKRLKKGVIEETNRGMALFNEYTSKYSNLSWDEFLKLRKEQESQLTTDGKAKGGKK